MSALKKYQNKKIAIYGMGLTGISAAKAFKKLKADKKFLQRHGEVEELLGSNLPLPIGFGNKNLNYLSAEINPYIRNQLSLKDF